MFCCCVWLVLFAYVSFAFAMLTAAISPFAMSDCFFSLPVSDPAGRQRLLYQLAGVVPSPLLLELLSCPLCARSLETLELELGDLEGGRGEADGLHDFHQVGMRGWDTLMG